MSLSLSSPMKQPDWGCSYAEVQNLVDNNIKICFVQVDDLSIFVNNLSQVVLDNSWMVKLDAGIQRSYRKTVAETAKILIQIFRSTQDNNKIASDFGELMVSIGSSNALEQLFEHTKIPISELWKPQIKQNEGFDFHTACSEHYINFGEAKFSSSKNSYRSAIEQAIDFVQKEKHLMDRNHLINFFEKSQIDNLDEDQFGIVAAFSINSEDPITIFQNAITVALENAKSIKVKNIYLVGVGEKC